MRDPYAIWVSEVMLQQTTVGAVLPYYARFLERFPDVASLARASEDDVLAQWTGLGYYRRARALRLGAAAVVLRHGGRVPGDVEALRTLPGIGRYTAGAIASVAFGLPAPIVDGNVKRVFARLFALPGEGAALERRCWPIAETLVRGLHPGDFNQAVMELGALVCTPKAPNCLACPVASHCAASCAGRQAEFPAPAPRKTIRNRRLAAAWVERRGRVLLVRRSAGGSLRGTWDVPAVAIEGKETAATALTRASFAPGKALTRVTHTILTTRFALEVVAAKAPAGRGRDRLWIEPSKLGEIATSGATMKIARAVLPQKRSQADKPSGSSAGSSPRKL